MGLLRVLFVFAMVFGISSFAAEAVKVTWFKPMHVIPAGGNKAFVVLYGRTSPGASVSVDKSQIVSVNIYTPSGNELNKSEVESTTADRNGFFQLSLELPLGLAQVPISFAAGEAAPSVYVMPFQISLDQAEILVKVVPDVPAVAELRERTQRQFEVKYGLYTDLAKKLQGTWVTAALGYNYQSVDQTLGDGTSLAFASPPALGFGVHLQIARDRWMARGAYLYTPGELTGLKAPMVAANSDYVWRNFTVEGGWNFDIGSWREKVRLSALLGLQSHLLPHFNLVSGNEIETKTTQLMNISAGPLLTAQVRRNLILETFLRYQYPFSSSSLDGREFNIHPNTSFDGSIALLWEWREKRYWSIGWFGQWLKYDFDYVAPLGSFNGSDSLFYTSLDLRYVWQW